MLDGIRGIFPRPPHSIELFCSVTAHRLLLLFASIALHRIALHQNVELESCVSSRNLFVQCHIVGGWLYSKEHSFAGESSSMHISINVYITIYITDYAHIQEPKYSRPRPKRFFFSSGRVISNIKTGMEG